MGACGKDNVLTKYSICLSPRFPASLRLGWVMWYFWPISCGQKWLVSLLGQSVEELVWDLLTVSFSCCGDWRFETLELQGGKAAATSSDLWMTVWGTTPPPTLAGCVKWTKTKSWASLVAQWFRIHLPMQGTRVRALVREDPTCRRATKPVHHNCWACALEPESHNYWACALQLLKLECLEPVLCNKRSHLNEKSAHHNKE